MLDVPHPGPEPELYSFPFVRADQAVGALDELADELLRLARDHEDAAATATVGFHGRAADDFTELLDATLEALREDARLLRGQADLLEQEIAVARRRHEDSVDARRDWRLRRDAWATAQQAR